MMNRRKFLQHAAQRIVLLGHGGEYEAERMIYSSHYAHSGH